jgi:plasmid stabilization system protein ParE
VVAEVIFSPEARQDIFEIWEFIAEDNIDAADQMVGRIEEACRRLAAMPGMGHERSDITDQPVRFWPVKSYLVIYRGSGPVEIVRILSGYRDIAAILEG